MSRHLTRNKNRPELYKILGPKDFCAYSANFGVRVEGDWGGWDEAKDKSKKSLYIYRTAAPAEILEQRQQKVPASDRDVIRPSQVKLRLEMIAMQSQIEELRAELDRFRVTQAEPVQSPEAPCQISEQVAEITKLTNILFGLPVEVEPKSDDDDEVRVVFVVKAGPKADVNQMVARQLEWYARIRKDFSDVRRAVMLTVAYE